MAEVVSMIIKVFRGGNMVKKLSVVVGESASSWLDNMLVRSFLGKIFQWSDISGRSR